MSTLRSHLRRMNLLIAVMCSIVFWPAATYADTTTTPCTPPAATTPGVNEPTGADAGTFTYNCETGLWENQYYTYDPATGARAPKYPIVYTYNPSTGQYDTTIWAYNAPSGQYVQRTQSVSQPPAGATVVGGPQPAVATSPNPGGDSIGNTGPDSTNSISGTGGSASISGTGPDSDNTITSNSGNTATDNSLLNALIYNNVNATSQSGDATVASNTTGGDATTGNSQTVANVANLLQSTSNALGDDAITFVANINGDVNGDLLLDPNALKQIQPSTTAGTTTPLSGNNNLTVNNQTNAIMNNTISVGAGSGNADVSDNTTGGNATSGSAKAVADVVNLINSAITSGKSFIGVVNINGNLNGDILLPPDFIDQLVASNVPTVSIDMTGPNSVNTVNNAGSNTTTVNNTNNLGINNAVTASAQTGSATVSGNTAGGNATSGAATTHITAFNLTGSSVIGSNDLLVFVNVMGTWVGMIVNAPPGATAAELGGGVTSLSNTGPGSTNTASGTGNNSTTLNNDANLQINNTINAAARSGDATVSHNTTGGNATSGDAQAAVNLLNVQNSSLSLANWFGILFINVFGTWHGSFGINTAAGDPAMAIPPVNGGGSASRNIQVPAAVQAFRFVPHDPSAGPTAGATLVPVSGTTPTGPTSGGAVLAAHETALNTVASAKAPQLQAASGHSYWLPIGGVVLAFALLAADRYSSPRG